MMKYIFRAALTATVFVALALAAVAQAKPAPPKAGEKTVEEAYLQEDAETMMVKELVKADDKDSKVVALLYIKRALDGGRKNNDIRTSLQYLALENNQVVIRSAGLGVVTNNFPDIRAKACEYLGDFPSVESKDTLISVLHNTTGEDPMVLAEAIRSLGKIGINDDDEVIRAIDTTISHYSDLGIAEDRLAVYTLFAINDLAEKNHGIKDMATVTKTIMNFTKGSYIGSVRKLAMDTLDKLALYAAKSTNK
jgi:hypothetical protein